MVPRTREREEFTSRGAEEGVTGTGPAPLEDPGTPLSQVNLYVGVGSFDGPPGEQAGGGPSPRTDSRQARHRDSDEPVVQAERALGRAEIEAQNDKAPVPKLEPEASPADRMALNPIGGGSGEETSRKRGREHPRQGEEYGAAVNLATQIVSATLEQAGTLASAKSPGEKEGFSAESRELLERVSRRFEAGRVMIDGFLTDPKEAPLHFRTEQELGARNFSVPVFDPDAQRVLRDPVIVTGRPVLVQALLDPQAGPLPTSADQARTRVQVSLIDLDPEAEDMLLDYKLGLEEGRKGLSGESPLSSETRLLRLLEVEKALETFMPIWVSSLRFQIRESHWDGQHKKAVHTPLIGLTMTHLLDGSVRWHATSEVIPGFEGRRALVSPNLPDHVSDEAEPQFQTWLDSLERGLRVPQPPRRPPKSRRR